MALITDGRFETIERAKNDLLEATNIETSPDEMKVLNDFLYRCWQMGWLKQYEGGKTITEWIPVSERLPETDNTNEINEFDVLLVVRPKKPPEKTPQVYIGKLRPIKGDDGSGNFWGIKTAPCEWTIWGWSYYQEPEVLAWMPLPEPYKEGAR